MKNVRQKLDWRTSTAAISAVLSSLGVIVGAIAKEQYDIAFAAVPALISSIGLFFARDSVNSDQDVGAR